ncbi:DUF2336 domain-containing protein [Sphingosinicella rhizophila]|uniref:DUF2336 domain-containing protein n=1 Tax=Sphingosinicella rhizophila TaxID=3050082 RepID=A0ABU3Q2I5_9SPHN|nr:DUF2336 domain-containing protein [Sphingosinicella sp. GR2756]MDT9597497.1 DUF2336 domain-containing protein [Sphingosinicella sp. GR2756]
MSVAFEDLRLPRDLRLSEWQRTVVTALRARLVRQIEDELRSGVAGALEGTGNEALHAALSSAHVVIAGPILDECGAPSDPGLTSAILRRAEEHRLFRAGGGDHAFLLELAGDADEEVASGAMALLIAQSSRFDPFQDPIMARTELSAHTHHFLVWTIAAALRRYMIEQHGLDSSTADEALAGAAAELLTDYDEGETVEALSVRLAWRLRDTGRLDDEMVARTLLDGSLPLFLAALAMRSGFDVAATWEIASEPSGRGIALLLRVAGIARDAAGTILFRIEEDEVRLAGKIDLFDLTDEQEAGRQLRLWRIDPAYRAAIARLAA